MMLMPASAIPASAAPSGLHGSCLAALAASDLQFSGGKAAHAFREEMLVFKTLLFDGLAGGRWRNGSFSQKSCVPQALPAQAVDPSWPHDPDIRCLGHKSNGKQFRVSAVDLAALAAQLNLRSCFTFGREGIIMESRGACTGSKSEITAPGCTMLAAQYCL